MPEPTKISFAEWRKYEASVFFKACRETSKASLGRGLLVTLAAAVGRWWYGFMAQHEIWAQILIFIGAGAIVYLGEILFKLLRSPAKMAIEMAEKFDSEKQRLETENEMLKLQLDPALSDSASALLVEASKGDGRIIHMKGFGGTTIQANKREFIEPNNPRSYAQWKSAFDELKKGKYIEDGNDYYPLTEKGYRESDRLKPIVNKGENGHK